MADTDPEFNFYDPKQNAPGNPNTQSTVGCDKKNATTLYETNVCSTDHSIRGFTVVPYIDLGLKTTVCALNMLLVLLLIWKRKKFHSTFFQLVRILSFTIAFQCLIDIIFNSIPVIFLMPYGIGEQYITLYVSAFYGIFAPNLVFLLSLNRYAVIGRKQFNEVIFENKRYWYVLGMTVIGTSICTYLLIALPDISRYYMVQFGYVDFALHRNLYQWFCRVLFIVPLSAIILYILVFYEVRKQSQTQRLSQMGTTVAGTAERNIMMQGAFITFAYGIVSVGAEIIRLGNYDGLSFELTLWNTFTYLPDFVIPLTLLTMNKSIRRAVKSKTVNIAMVARSPNDTATV